MNGFIGGLLGGLGKGIQQAQVMKQEKERQDLLNQLAKIQGKQAELSMQLQLKEAARQDKQQAAKDEFLSQFDQPPGIGDPALAGQRGGDFTENKPDILTMLSDPRVLKSGLASGVLNVGGIAALQNAQRQNMWNDPEQLKSIIQGGGSNGGMEVSGVNISADGPQIQMRAPQYAIQEVTRPDGSKGITYIPKRPTLGSMGGVQTSPSQMDMPMSQSELNAWRNPEGKPPPAGITPNQAIAGGFKVQPSEELSAKTPEAGAKVALIAQGMEDIPKAIGLVFPNASAATGLGEPNKKVILEASAPGGGIGDGRKLRLYMRNAISAKLRLETGAAAPDSEVDEMLSRFLPGPIDIATSPGVIGERMQSLQNFLGSALDYTTLPDSMRKRLSKAQPAAAQEGQIYEDANGNRARLVNGKYEPL